MNITLDLPSVLTGGAVALVLGLVAGFSPQVTTVAPQRPATAVPLDGALRPAARDLVFFRGTDPAFTVPAGKIFVIMKLATDSGSARSILRTNGGPASGGQDFLDLAGGASSYDWDFTEGGIGGWPFVEGTTLELVNRINGLPGRYSEWFMGYLEDA